MIDTVLFKESTNKRLDWIDKRIATRDKLTDNPRTSVNDHNEAMRGEIALQQVRATLENTLVLTELLEHFRMTADVKITAGRLFRDEET